MAPPGPFLVQRTKHEAWGRLRGLAPREARERYVHMVDELMQSDWRGVEAAPASAGTDVQELRLRVLRRRVEVW